MGDALPTIRLFPQNFVEVTCGSHYTCVLNSTGFVFCFGRNDKGQLGNGMSFGSVGCGPEYCGSNDMSTVVAVNLPHAVVHIVIR
jgi:alpha-tubulin suppressor-like RCC1 family protein